MDEEKITGYIIGTLDGVRTWGVLYPDGTVVSGDGRVRDATRYEDARCVPQDEVPGPVRSRLAVAYDEAMVAAGLDRDREAEGEGEGEGEDW